ncbi:hypothetical protein BurJ1DRAFT_1473 [Burkholderiales bacterium JOSHI_001]|nr:hypothetical protein BurJ1DRAFT_1473 [Burkholderiales bacterium JOSHI_001]
MPDATLDSLIAVTRRHLWRVHLGAAVRRAAWGSAGLLLLAAAWHLGLGPLAPPLLAALLCAIWAAALAWAALQRPGDTDCALWADRHLGGASAFSTWLDLNQGRHQAADPGAVAWLQDWATARVPPALRQLAHRPPAEGGARPVLALAVCAGLLAAVATLSPPRPPRRPVPAPDTALAAARPSTDGLAAASAPGLQDLAGELSQALRRREPQDAARGASGQAGPAGGAAASSGASAGAAPRPANEVRAGGLAQAGAAPAAGDGVPAATPPGATAASGATAGTGQGAGKSVDEHSSTAPGRTRAPAVALREVALAATDAPPQRQADMAQGATYDESQPERRPDASALPIAAPATAPPADRDARLTPTESSYVQAWMKAITRSSR